MDPVTLFPALIVLKSILGRTSPEAVAGDFNKALNFIQTEPPKDCEEGIQTEWRSELQEISKGLLGVLEELEALDKQKNWKSFHSSRKRESLERRMKQLHQELEMLVDMVSKQQKLNEIQKLETDSKAAPRVDKKTEVFLSIAKSSASSALQQLIIQANEPSKLSSVVRVDSFPGSISWATLSWLPDLDAKQKHREFRGARFPGSKFEVLEGGEFKAWMDHSSTQPSPSIWCTGPPGVGKTTLSSMVVDELLSAKSKTNAGIGFAYFYFDHTTKFDLVQIVACLLKQLCQSCGFIPPSVKDLYEKSHDGKDMTLKELLKTIHQLDQRQSFVVLDALDEFTPANELMAVIINLSEQPRCRLFLTSRVKPKEGYNFERFTQIFFHPDIDSIRDYIATKIDENIDAGFLVDDEFKEQIIVRILGKYKGSFLWATLAVPTILDQITRRDMEEASESLPSGLAEILKHGILKTESQSPRRAELAKFTLQWLRYAQAPLTAQAICEAFAVQHGDEHLDRYRIPAPPTIINVCLGLVKMDNDTGMIRLVHRALHHYLSNQVQQQQFFPRGQETLAINCLQYLLLRDFQKPCKTRGALRKRLDLFCFFRYAASNWGHHVREASSDQPMKLALELLNDSGRVAACSQLKYETLIEDTQLMPVEKEPSLHIAARYGIFKLVEELIGHGAKIDARDTDGLTALHEAAKGGWEKVSELLLAARADCYAVDQYSRIPAYYAIKNRHANLLPLLLKRNGAPILKDGFHPVQDSLLLKTAIENGDSETVKFILDCLSFSSDVLKEAMTSAAEQGHLNVVRLLLDDNVGISGETLSAAISSGNDCLVKLLLDMGANTNDISGGTSSLHLAARSGYMQTVRLLLNAGADVNIRDKQDRTPIFEAIGCPDSGMIRYLLRDGADVQIHDKEGSTPLHEAAIDGDTQAIATLLDAGANLNAKNFVGQRPLDCAKGESEAHRLLRTHEALMKLDKEAKQQIEADEQEIPSFWLQEAQAKKFLDEERPKIYGTKT